MPSSLRKRNDVAYSKATQIYRAGTATADNITRFLLELLQPLKGSRGSLYVYNFAGINGYLTPRIDANGLIVFAVYTRRNTSELRQLTFRRNKEKYPRAQRPLFLTAPNVWAHLNNYPKQILDKEDYRKWKADLEIACEVDNYIEEQPWDLKFTLSQLPDPDCPQSSDTEISVHETGIWEKCEKRLKRRLFTKRRRLLYAVLHYFVERWIASANSPSNWTGKALGWPKAIKASYGYLASSLEITLKQARAAIKDLDQLGYIQAVYYAPSGKPNKKGIYYFFPDSALEFKNSSLSSDASPIGALDWMRKQKLAPKLAEQEAQQKEAYFDALEETIELEHEIHRTSLEMTKI